jgi:hypothetical protein
MSTSLRVLGTKLTGKMVTPGQMLASRTSWRWARALKRLAKERRDRWLPLAVAALRASALVGEKNEETP